MHLHTVDGKPGRGVQLKDGGLLLLSFVWKMPKTHLFMANVTFEMLGLLVLNENLLVIEFTVAIPGGRWRND